MMEVVISTEVEEDDDEALLRSLIRPEEDRRRLHPNFHGGAYRWFRSANVIPGRELSLGGGLKAMLPDIDTPTVPPRQRR